MSEYCFLLQMRQQANSGGSHNSAPECGVLDICPGRSKTVETSSTGIGASAVEGDGQHDSWVQER